MSQFFDTLKAIALSNKPQSEKVKEMQKMTGMTATAARQQIATIVFMNKGTAPANVAEATLRFTIGVEIECFNINKQSVINTLNAQRVKAIATGYNHTDYADTYKLGSDSSICGSDSCEVVSPILNNLNSLKKVCKVINEAGAQVNSSCGLHVHFGAKDLTIAQWVRIIRNYAALESVIDSFMPMSRRGNNNFYCRSITGNAIRCFNATSMYDIYEAFDHDRYHKVNVMAFRGHKTIEFRHHSGTTDFTKIENWINFLNCHPFRDEESGVSFAHNGILDIKPIDDMTDSETAFRTRIVPVIREHGFQSSEFIFTNYRIIGGSRFAYIDKKGEYRIYGAFTQHKGCWYSNRNFLPYIETRYFRSYQ